MDDDKRRWTGGRDAVFGIGVSVGIPFTQSNVTVAGSIGTKDKVVDGLPSYTHGRLAGTRTSSISRGRSPSDRRRDPGSS
jgi:hypothetical protein